MYTYKDGSALSLIPSKISFSRSIFALYGCVCRTNHLHPKATPLFPQRGEMHNVSKRKEECDTVKNTKNCC